MPGARGARAFEHVPLIPGFIKALGSTHRGDSFLQHSPGAGVQHTEAASQGPSPLPAKAPRSGAFLGSETSGPSVPPGLGSPHSMLALAVWKREECAEEWTQEQSWGASLIYGTQTWGATRAVLHFPLCNLLIPQHLKIPQISVNLKSRTLPNA